MKHIPKNIEVQGIRHAKEVICDLLNTNDALVAALEELCKIDGQNHVDGTHGYQHGSPVAKAWESARSALKLARGE